MFRVDDEGHFFEFAVEFEGSGAVGKLMHIPQQSGWMIGVLQRESES